MTRSSCVYVASKAEHGAKRNGWDPDVLFPKKP